MNPLNKARYASKYRLYIVQDWIQLFLSETGELIILLMNHRERSIIFSKTIIQIMIQVIYSR